MPGKLEDRLGVWLSLWQYALPRRAVKKQEWQAAIERFLTALKRNLEAAPLGWWPRILLLYRLQKALAAQGVPAEALRPLVLAIVLRVYLA